MSKVALITGITEQDGSYLSELLFSKDYRVHGIVRRVALDKLVIDMIESDLKLVKDIKYWAIFNEK